MDKRLSIVWDNRLWTALSIVIAAIGLVVLLIFAINAFWCHRRLLRTANQQANQNNNVNANVRGRNVRGRSGQTRPASGTATTATATAGATATGGNGNAESIEMQ
ncbi:hypothetical protein T310_9819 [Rasamsonia emersonii CBS 393.64]|uniref:Uncharacterized protein n=1 Tax=Rasamsonia emersonii (strain ATCC 16479 / CBS 393.64 / IMI 116815) TaxID=1408163 RepID=A0A0F4YED5_RASE3|nr:hypothetical protein T310_9819 [Rasamsonia emersonii CBS 393.64]KKA16552.1 hypothetical protein T310_9819 [Rasamsonia emersonii CBS 393.64]